MESGCSEVTSISTYPLLLFLKTDPETGERAIAAIVFDGDYLRDQFLPQALDHVMSSNVAEGQTDKNVAMMIRAKSDSTPFRLRPWLGWG